MAFRSNSIVVKRPTNYTLDSWSIAQLSAFYTQNRSVFISHARRILKDNSKAEEIVQDALVKFMLAAPELSSETHAISYVHRSIENLCIDYFRAENRKPNLVALDDVTSEVESNWQASGDHSAEMVAAEDAAIIRQALSFLSPAERAALVMWEVEGRSTSEIAEELGIKETTVRHTVSRARASLRRVLEELVIDEDRGLTALDLLSTTYKKATKIAGKSSKIALTFILVLTAYLGLNSLTSNGIKNTVTISSSQLTENQDLPELVTQNLPEPVDLMARKKFESRSSLSTIDYDNHMFLAVAQLETIELMITVLNQVEGDSTNSEQAP